MQFNSFLGDEKLCLVYRGFLLVPFVRLDLQWSWGMLVNCTLEAMSSEIRSWGITVPWWRKLKPHVIYICLTNLKCLFLLFNNSFFLWWCIFNHSRYVVSSSGAVVGDDLPGHTILGCDNTIGHHAVVGNKCQDMKYKVSFQELWTTFSILSSIPVDFESYWVLLMLSSTLPFCFGDSSKVSIFQRMWPILYLRSFGYTCADVHDMIAWALVLWGFGYASWLALLILFDCL